MHFFPYTTNTEQKYLKLSCKFMTMSRIIVCEQKNWQIRHATLAYWNSKWGGVGWGGGGGETLQ